MKTSKTTFKTSVHKRFNKQYKFDLKKTSVPKRKDNFQCDLFLNGALVFVFMSFQPIHTAQLTKQVLPADMAM